MNSAPTLTLPADQTINELTLLDHQRHRGGCRPAANTLTFELVSGPQRADG